jgi:hypothetical protein
MCNSGALAIAELQRTARLTLASPVGIHEVGAHDVMIKETRAASADEQGNVRVPVFPRTASRSRPLLGVFQGKFERRTPRKLAFFHQLAGRRGSRPLRQSCLPWPEKQRCSVPAGLHRKFRKLAFFGSIQNYACVQTLTEKLIEQGLRNKLFSERQLERVVGAGPASRYGLVNRAVKAQELHRIRRGLYVLSPRFRTEPVHPFAIAQALAPGSYVSFETALSFHGWIPEAVRITSSVVPGRKSSTLEHPSFGSCAFHPIALNRSGFLELVERKQLESQVALVARPLRALMDLAAFRKLEWRGLDWLTQGMRIDMEDLRSITREDVESLSRVYKQKGANHFLRTLAGELWQ